MKARFVLTTDSLMPAQERAIAEKLAPPLWWWHRIPNLWLIVDPNGVHTVVSIRDLVATETTNRKLMVVPVATGDWAGTINMTSGAAGDIDWLRQYWEPI